MNIQTERLENHTARLTVEVEPERLEQARQAAIRKVGKMVQVPGFRKGKAPNQVVIRYIGEARILEEAIDELGQEIYRESLDNAEDVKPYGPGSLDDIKYDPLVFVYTVPLQPTIELGDYRDVRRDYTAPEVTDADVERTMESLRENAAESQPSEEPAAMGDRVTVDIHSFFVDEDHTHDHEEHDEAEDEADAETDVVAEADAEEAHDHDHDHDDHDHDEDEHDHGGHVHDHDGEPYIHEHSLQVILRDGDNEPVAPGFAAQMVGATVGETREFIITFPTKEEDSEVSDEMAGRKVEFVVAVENVEKVTLPDWTPQLLTDLAMRFPPTPEEIDALEAEAEELSALITEDPDEEDEEAASDEVEATDETETDDSVITSGITQDQIRARVKRSLQLQAERDTDRDYAEGVLDAVVQNAEVSYPEAMMQDQLERMVQSLEQRLRQQGMSLEMYQSITGKTRDDLFSDYREAAADTIKRSLVLLEVAVKENLNVGPDDFEKEITNMMQMFGGGSPELRKTFDSPSFRESIYNRILQDKTYDRLTLIGKGEAPEPETTDTAVAVSETAADAENAEAAETVVSEADENSNG